MPQPPVWSGHADFCHPFEFIALMRVLEEPECDIMLEAKSKDLALLRLRRDLQRYAPEVAARFGLTKAGELLDESKPIVVAANAFEPAAAESDANAG